MSQIYLASLVILLSQLARALGLDFGEDQLMNVATFLISVVSALWIMMRRHQQGDINAGGIRKV